jgi:hypothetical protein
MLCRGGPTEAGEHLHVGNLGMHVCIRTSKLVGIRIASQCCAVGSVRPSAIDLDLACMLIWTAEKMSKQKRCCRFERMAHST